MGAGRSNFTKEGNAEGDKFFVVTELANNGELFDLIQYADGLGGEKIIYGRELFKQVCEGVKYIHDNGIAHRDLKLENCFLDDNVAVKVADFGLMKVFGGANG